MPAIMMVPRAYACSFDQRQSLSPISNKRRPASPVSKARKQEQEFNEKIEEGKVPKNGEKVMELRKPKRMTSVSHPTPSQPVVIPTRTTSPKKGRALDSEPLHDQHDPSALSPSMAALLAVTPLSAVGARAIKQGNRLTPDDFRHSVSSTSPHYWSILQGPPDRFDLQGHDMDLDAEVGSICSRSTLDPERTDISRSRSSDSIPSLDIEPDVFTSPESPPMPRTPSSRRAKSPKREKVAKVPAVSEPLAVGEAHPLAIEEVLEDSVSLDESFTGGRLFRDTINEPPRRSRDSSMFASSTRSSSMTKSQFRSNLTASIQRLKNAAYSISLPTPSVSTVLAVNSSLLTDENRPSTAPASTLPQSSSRPRLPHTNSAFSPETYATLARDIASGQPRAADLYFSSTPSEEYRPIASSIQLQPYLRLDASDDALLDKATAPPVFLSSSPPPPVLLPGIDSPRPREPRENSDFLRVVVLEMNMRRAGKLENIAGRAKIWIGPRSDKKQDFDGHQGQDVAARSPKTLGRKTTRAERGMSEVVAEELADAMEVDGPEASVARDAAEPETKDDFSEQNQPKMETKKGEIPARWQASLT